MAFCAKEPSSARHVQLANCRLLRTRGTSCATNTARCFENPHTTMENASTVEQDGVTLSPECIMLVVGILLLLGIAAFVGCRRRRTAALAANKLELQSLLPMTATTTTTPHSDSSANWSHLTPSNASLSPVRPRDTRSFAGRWLRQVVSTKRVSIKKISFEETVIARGQHCDVYLGRYRRARVVAIKKLHASAHDINEFVADFMQEICLQGSLNHPNIVALIGFVWSKPQRSKDLCAVLEYMNGGDLRTLLQHRRHVGTHATTGFDREKCHIACQIARALVYLHSHTVAIVHHALSAENVLLNDRLQAKLSDFGAACKSWDSTANVTRRWIPPEVMERHCWDEKADMFAFGALLFELSTLQVYSNMSSGPAPTVGFATNGVPSMDLLMAACLSPNPAARPTAGTALHQIEVCLQVPIPPPQHSYAGPSVEMELWWNSSGGSRGSYGREGINVSMSSASPQYAVI